MSLIGNVDTPASYVADYMQACVGMLGIPAGGFTADIEAFGATNGYDVEALYGAMLNSSIGRSIYAPGSSNATFAAKLVEKLGGSLLSDDAEAWALDWAETQLDNGMSRAALAMEAVESISAVDTADENFGAVALQFANRIEIANYYTFSTTNPSSTASTLTSVLSSVDNETDVTDPAAVLEENTDPTVSTGQSFTLTTGADSIVGDAGVNSISGTTGASSGNSYSAGDVIDGGAGVDKLTLTAVGSTAAAAVTVKNVETIEVKDVSGIAINAVLFENDPTIAFVSTLDAQTSSVTSASLGSTYSLAGQGDLTVDFLSTSGTVAGGNADTAKLALAGTGSSTNSVTVNVSDTDTMEYVTVATSGTNYATITAGSAAEKVTITGDGTNNLTLTGASSLTVDASTSTGTNNFIMSTNLSVGDTLKGGTGADEITATIGSTGQVIATSTDVEKLDLSFTAAGIVNATNMTGLTSVEVSNSENSTLTGLVATVTSLTLDATTANTKTASFAFGATNAGEVTLNVGATDSTSANVSTDVGDVTLTSHSGSLVVNSTGEAANAINALAAATSTSLTFKGTKGFTQTGAVTATAMTSMTVTADAGPISLGTITSDANVSSVTLSASGAEANDISITNLDLDHIQNLSVTATGGADVTITDMDILGVDKDLNNHVVSVTLNAGTSATDTLSDIAFTVSETTNTTNSVLDSITVTGAGDVSITANDADIDTPQISASTHTGSLTFTGTTQDAAIVITLGNASSGETNTVTTGSGNDVITGGSGVDVITGGAGDDAITAGGGADTITSGTGNDTIDLTETTAAVDKLIYAEEGAGNVDTVTGFATGSGGDQIHLDVSEINGGAIVDTTGTQISAATVHTIVEYTVGTVLATNTAGASILKVTNTTGINSITDINTALAAHNITMDGSGTDFANNDGIIIAFYDADDAKMVVGYIEDSAAATAGVFDGTGTTFVEITKVGISTAAFTALTADNFDIL